MENVQGSVIEGIKLNVTESDMENESLSAVLDDYIRTNDSEAKMLFMTLQNKQHNRSIPMSSSDRIILNKELIMDLEELGVDYEVVRKGSVG